MLGDERYTTPSSNITVINNIVFGAYRNFYWWQGVQGGGMVNVLVAHNTFVNSKSEANFLIDQGEHRNVRVAANIIQQDGTLPIAYVTSNPDLHFSANLWSKRPPSTASAPDDVIGDPQLMRAGQAVTPDWFKPKWTSPARNRSNVLAEVSKDFFGIFRGVSPDMGAIEYRARHLTAPQLLMPRAGALTGTLRPRFSWVEIDGATKYQIQIARAGIMSPQTVNAFVTAPSFLPTRKLPRGVILYWRVRAQYPTGWGSWSGTRSFIISP
jgi:hypothetical protein